MLAAWEASFIIRMSRYQRRGARLVTEAQLSGPCYLIPVGSEYGPASPYLEPRVLRVVLNWVGIKPKPGTFRSKPLLPMCRQQRA
ncbi:MAG: hypothetical protein ACI841_003814 [Planctomycetota bacterium]|jgi:hypothetical protein